MDPYRCLVLLPLGVTRRQDGATFLALYEHLLLPALHATGVPLRIFRSDEVMRSGLSLHDGQQWLQNPHLVVADLTTRHSGVVHDLTLRTALAPRTILISQQGEHIPSCFASYRRIIYTVSEAGIAGFRRQLGAHVRAICVPSAAEAPHAGDVSPAFLPPSSRARP